MGCFFFLCGGFFIWSFRLNFQNFFESGELKLIYNVIKCSENFVKKKIRLYFLEKIYWKCKQKRTTCILGTLLLVEIFNCVHWSCILLLFTSTTAKTSVFFSNIRQKHDTDETWSTMFKIVPDLLKSHSSIHCKIFQIKSVIILLSLNACLKFCAVVAGPSDRPSIQQEQELLLLEALSKRQPSYYGTSNSLMDILGRSMNLLLISCVFFVGWVHFCFEKKKKIEKKCKQTTSDLLSCYQKHYSYLRKNKLRLIGISIKITTNELSFKMRITFSFHLANPFYEHNGQTTIVLFLMWIK